jgi:hypothetical protein
MLKAKPPPLAWAAASISRSSSSQSQQPDLDSEVTSPSKGRNANFPPAADPRPAPDVTGESDYAFFSRRPGISSRTRLPFENEYPVCVLLPGRSAFVRIVIIKRDDNGQPTRIARRLSFCNGGHA